MRRLGMMIAVALAASALAAPAAAAPLAKAESGRYALDPTHASLTWRVKHFGLSWYTARFTRFTSTLQLDAADPTRSSVEVSIDPKSVRTDFPAPERVDFDAKIATQVLNAGKYPAITFRSTTLTATGATTGRLTGDLTFMGVTKPVTLDVTFNAAIDNPMDKSKMVGFSATGGFKRSDFGATSYLPVVGDEVQLVIEVEYKKQ